MFGRLVTGPAREPELRTSRSVKLETLRLLLSTSEETTLPQVRALLLLSTRGAQTVKSLAEGLSSHEFTIDRLCSRLVTRGLLVRVPAAANPDVVIALSTAGRRVIEDAIHRQVRECPR
jgi:DNA-binding MarR family transcriptional regulator